MLQIGSAPRHTPNAWLNCFSTGTMSVVAMLSSKWDIGGPLKLLGAPEDGGMLDCGIWLKLSGIIGKLALCPPG